MSQPNRAHSMHERLLKVAKAEQEEFQNLLMRYARERWLYRLSLSAQRERFVLKGAMLFAFWSDEPHRLTQDLDLLGYGGSSVAELEAACREVCAVLAEEDGLQFLPESVKGAAIREENIYDGVRLTLRAMLGKARIPLQIDIGFGDVVTPEPELIEYPAMLGLPAPHLRAYCRETVIAEKFHALVDLGLRNTRLKDFYDLWVLAGKYAFDGAVFAETLRAIFARRRTPLPAEIPLGLTAEFADAPRKQQQWQAFLRRGKLRAGTLPLSEVVDVLQGFLLPPLQAAREGKPFSQQWRAGGPWA